MSLGFCRAGEVKKVKRQNGGPPSVDKGSLREPAVEAVAGDWDVSQCRVLVHTQVSSFNPQHHENKQTSMSPTEQRVALGSRASAMRDHRSERGGGRAGHFREGSDRTDRTRLRQLCFCPVMDRRREESHCATSTLVVSLTVLATDPEGPRGEDVPASDFPGPIAQNPLSQIRVDIKTVLR